MTADPRDDLSRQLLDEAYACLPPLKRSVIDLMADERPSGAAPWVEGEADRFWDRQPPATAAPPSATTR